MLSDAFLARLDTLQLAMKGQARGGAGGIRRSRQTGSSAEFSDYREYIPGDDIRRIDWNALARFDRLFLKLFMEEQESAVTILLDGSGSMAEKWETARKAAEAVGYLALTGGDRLQLICLQESGNRLSPVLSGRQAYPRMEAFLDTVSPSGAGGLTGSVLKLENLRKGLCFLVSDCYAEEGLGQSLDYLRFRGQEPAVIQVLSTFEMAPELDGALRLEDCETGGKTEVLADREAMDEYAESLAGFLKETKESCWRREAPYMLLDAGKIFEEEWIPLLSESRVI